MVDYANLKTRIKNWLENDYAEFDADIDNMIELAEHRISKELNLDAMIEYQAGTLTAGQHLLAKDTPVVSVRHFTITVSGEIVTLFFRQTSFLDDYWPDRTKTDIPRYYANYDETRWQMAPIPKAAYPFSIETEQRITGLSDSMTNTWLSDNAPDLLFYAATFEAGVFDRDSDDAGRFGELYNRALESVREEVARVRSDRNQEQAG